MTMEALCLRLPGEPTVDKIDKRQNGPFSVILADVSTAFVPDPDGRSTWQSAREAVLGYPNAMEDTADRLRPILEQARDFQEYRALAGG